NFYNVDYTDLYVSSNGFVMFGADDGNGCCDGQSLPDSNSPNNLVAGYWTDLAMNGAGAGTAKYETFGSAPNRKFVIAYEGVDHCCSNGNPDVNFQIILYETTNVIEVHTSSSIDNGNDYTVTQGIEDLDGYKAAFLPGRTGATFDLTNDAVRFTPNSLHKIGDTVSVTWNDGGAGGDANADTLDTVTADLSSWGGLPTEAMVDDGSGCDAAGSDGIWTACVTVGAAGADGSPAPAVQVVDDAGNATSAAGPATATDDVPPTVSAGYISVAGATGAGGAFKVGDTVRVTWDDSASGDNNGDTAYSAADLYGWGGSGAALTVDDGSACDLAGSPASGDGISSACYTLVAGEIDTSSAQTQVIALDDGGNVTATNEGNSYTVDNYLPIVTAGNIAVTGASGSSGQFLDGDTVTVTWDLGLDGSVDIVQETADLSAWGGSATEAMVDDGSGCDASGSDNIWTACYTLVAAPVTTTAKASVTATDDADNVTTTLDDTAYKIKTTGSSGGGSIQPSAAMSTPNGGESLMHGTTKQVFWSAQGTGMTGVKLLLSTNGGATYPTVVLASGTNNGFYDWTVPDVNTTTARMKIQVIGAGDVLLASDESDANFAIVGTPEPPKSNGGGGGGGGGIVTPPQETTDSGTGVSHIVKENELESSATGAGAMERETANQHLPPVVPVDSLVKLVSDGNPATDVDAAVYYVGLDAKRHPFPSLASYSSWYESFAGVQEVDAATLASIPLGKPILSRPGTLWVKITSDPKTYYVAPGNKLRWIKDEATALALGGEHWNQNIIDVDVSLFVQYSEGDPIDLDALSIAWPAGQLVRETADGPVTYVAKSARRAFDGSGFSSNHFQSRCIRTSGAAAWMNAAAGTPIVGLEDGLFSLMH
ncbi:MAG TPA: hypothetical protein VLC10_01395, partial [Patescibacteria group bacterium]|nr:hypothetical protein [Patescibacteria group bacterium]